MQLRDYVKFNSDFRDSVNLYLDLNKVDKIRSYIPTKSSVDILEQYVDAVLDNKQHSTLLIGPYGKGKSHLLLMLLAALTLRNNAENDKLMGELCNKIKKVDEGVQQDKYFNNNTISKAFPKVKSLLQSVEANPWSVQRSMVWTNVIRALNFLARRFKVC